MSRTFRKIVIERNHFRYGWWSKDDLKLNNPAYKTVDNYYRKDGKLSVTNKKGPVKNHGSSRERMLFQNEYSNIMKCTDYEDYSYPDYRMRLKNVWYEYF